MQFTSREKHKVLEILNTPFCIDNTIRRLDDCIMVYTNSIFKAIANENINLVKYSSWKFDSTLGKLINNETDKIKL